MGRMYFSNSFMIKVRGFAQGRFGTPTSCNFHLNFSLKSCAMFGNPVIYTLHALSAKTFMVLQ